MSSNVAGTIYLLCFAAGGGLRRDARAHVRHYLGWTERDVDARLAEHLSGTGSPLVRAVVAAGQPVELVRTWPDRDRYAERALKKLHNTPGLCPTCSGPVALERGLLLRHDARAAWQADPAF